jgi:hypothetical protein
MKAQELIHELANMLETSFGLVQRILKDSLNLCQADIKLVCHLLREEEEEEENLLSACVSIFKGGLEETQNSF